MKAVFVACVSLGLGLAAARPAAAEVTVTCDVFEVWGTGDKPEVDPALPPGLGARLSKSLKSVNFKLLSKTSETLKKKKPTSITLAKGSAVLTLVEIVDKSGVRLVQEFTSGKKQAVQSTLSIAAGDWSTYGVNQSSKDGAEQHILAISCK
jgi:hypothetical protein